MIDGTIEYNKEKVDDLLSGKADESYVDDNFLNKDLFDDEHYIKLDNNYGIFAKRQNRTVTLKFAGDILPVQNGGASLIYTLPEKYRPEIDYTYFLVVPSGSNPTPSLVRIYHNGQIFLYNYTGSTMYYAYGSITYNL